MYISVCYDICVHIYILLQPLLPGPKKLGSFELMLGARFINRPSETIWWLRKECLEFRI